MESHFVQYILPVVDRCCGVKQTETMRITAVIFASCLAKWTPVAFTLTLLFPMFKNLHHTRMQPDSLEGSTHNQRDDRYLSCSKQTTYEDRVLLKKASDDLWIRSSALYGEVTKNGPSSLSTSLGDKDQV